MYRLRYFILFLFSFCASLALADTGSSILPSSINDFEVGDEMSLAEEIFGGEQGCEERILFTEDCADNSQHKNDACTFVGVGKSCLGIEYTCKIGCPGHAPKLPKGKEVSLEGDLPNEGNFEPNIREETATTCELGSYEYEIEQLLQTVGNKYVRKWCCDFGEGGNEGCECNKEIKNPGDCTTPEKCFECMMLAEVGHHADDDEDKTCAACIKKSMDERISKSSKINDYCGLNTSYHNDWAYSPADCICNTKDPAGGSRHSKETKYCRCCNGELTDAEKELLPHLQDIDANDCPVDDIDGYTSDGKKQYKIDPVTGKKVLCKKVEAKGCAAFDFWDCY